MVLGGQVNKEIVNMINQHGGKAVGLTGKDGNFIRAKKRMLASKAIPGDLIDIGQVGDISQIDPSLIALQMCIRDREIDDAKAAARFNDGVLELTLPKRAASQNKRLTVE